MPPQIDIFDRNWLRNKYFPMLMTGVIAYVQYRELTLCPFILRYQFVASYVIFNLSNAKTCVKVIVFIQL